MGFFGTSQQETELRQAVSASDARRDSSYSLGTTSAYDTADEDFGLELGPSGLALGPQGLALGPLDPQSESVDPVDPAGPHAVPEFDPAPDLALGPDLAPAELAPVRNSVPDPDHSINDTDTLGRDLGPARTNTSDKPESNDSHYIEKGSHEASNEEKDHAYTVEELDWDGPDDPANPYNWRPVRKWYVTLTTALMCLCVSLGSSLFVSGVFDLQQEMGVSRELCVSGLTFYLVGLAFGPAIAAPISETFGRAIVYITGFPLSMLFVMGVGLSKKIYQVLVCRFFAGLLASPALAIAGGTINDVWAIEDRGFAMACFCLAPFLGPVLGPVVGGFAAEHKGWQWTMWVSLMFCGAILPFVLLLPETYKPIILTRRAKKRNMKLNLKPMSQILKTTLTTSLLRPVQMLVVEPIVLLWSFYIAFVFAVLFGFFEAFPIIFQGEYGMDLGVSGLPFIAVGIGLTLGVVFFILLDYFVLYPHNPDGTKGKRDEQGNLIPGDPEGLLVVGKIGAVCLPISLFWLAWTGRNDIHWMCPTASAIPFGFGLILIFFINMLYFGISFPPASVASALGANNLLRYLLASVFPLFTTQMYERLHIDWATSLFAFISILLLPIPWFFQFYGKRLRERSKFGYSAVEKAEESKQRASIRSAEV